MSMAASTPLTLATWNLQSCQRGLPGVADQLRALDADIVVLQEVDRRTRRAGGVDQVAELAARAGYAHGHFFPALPWSGGGEYGLGVLSRHPLEDARVEPLPIEGNTEQRVVGSARVRLPGGPLSVLVTHLSHRPSEARLRERQVAHALAVLARRGHPAVLAGDFNDGPNSGTYRAVTRQLRDVFALAGEGDAGTFPLALGATLRLDYVFATPGVRPLRARVVRTRASDHYALSTTLSLPPVVANLDAEAPVSAAE